MKQDHIQQLYQLHLEEQHSIPMFLAAVISDMFSRQTFVSGMGEPSVSGIGHTMPDDEEDVHDEQEAVEEEEEVLEEVDDVVEGDESDEGNLILYNYSSKSNNTYSSQFSFVVSDNDDEEMEEEEEDENEGQDMGDDDSDDDIVCID